MAPLKRCVTQNDQGEKPMIDKTMLFRDQNGSLVLSEEHLHRMFQSLTKKAVAAENGRVYMHDKELAKNLPP